ncbi:type II toxin-antitoxin system RelE/ParE family toxin [Planctomycetota bacterium]
MCLTQVNLHVNIADMIREVQFYRTEAGRCHVEGFLDSLSSRQTQKVVWVLSLIEELDIVPVKYFKKLVNTDELWEVRVRVGRDTFRLLAFFDGPKVVVLAHGFQKKTQKTPRQFIDIAEARKKDYIQRKPL